MEQPICALCGMVIKPTDCKVTFQGVAQHMRCWGTAAAPKRQDDRHGRAGSAVSTASRRPAH